MPGNPDLDVLAAGRAVAFGKQDRKLEFATNLWRRFRAAPGCQVRHSADHLLDGVAEACAPGGHRVRRPDRAHRLAATRVCGLDVPCWLRQQLPVQGGQTKAGVIN